MESFLSRLRLNQLTGLKLILVLPHYHIPTGEKVGHCDIMWSSCGHVQPTLRGVWMWPICEHTCLATAAAASADFANTDALTQTQTKSFPAVFSTALCSFCMCHNLIKTPTPCRGKCAIVGWSSECTFDEPIYINLQCQQSGNWSHSGQIYRVTGSMKNRFIIISVEQPGPSDVDHHMIKPLLGSICPTRSEWLGTK